MHPTSVFRRRFAILAPALILAAAAPVPVTAQQSFNASAMGEISMTKVGIVSYTPFADTARVIRHATSKCGPRRICRKGWDLAAISVEAPGEILPYGVPAGFRVTIANLGAASSPEAPIRLQAGDAAAQLMIPALESGDTLVFIVPVKINGSGLSSLTIDPDNLSSEQNSQNNALDGPLFQAEGHVNVEVADMAIDPELNRRGSPIRVRVTLRNLSHALDLKEVILYFKKDAGSGVKEASARVALPLIPPQTELTGVVTLRGFTTLTGPVDGPKQNLVALEIQSSLGDRLGSGDATLVVAP